MRFRIRGWILLCVTVALAAGHIVRQWSPATGTFLTEPLWVFEESVRNENELALALLCGPAPDFGSKVSVQEFVRALRVLGVSDSLQLHQPDGNFQGSPELAAEVKALLDEYRPDWIFLPSPLDYHRDHVRIAAFLEPLCRRAPSVTQLLFYEIWAPVPATHVVDITEQAGRKQDALAAHATAMPHGDYQRAADGLNRYRGLYLGKNRLAEAFWVEPATGQGLFKLVQAMALQMLTLVLRRR